MIYIKTEARILLSIETRIVLSNETWITKFLPGSGCVDTAIWMHYMDAN